MAKETVWRSEFLLIGTENSVPCCQKYTAMLSLKYTFIQVQLKKCKHEL